MNSKDIRTLNGVDTDIKWIRETLIRLEQKMDRHEEETKGLTAWRNRVVGLSVGTSTIVAITISIITLIIKFR